MSLEPWNRPLPRELPLGGTKRFDPSLPDPTRIWVISTKPGSLPSLVVKSRSQHRTGELFLETGYAEGNHSLHSSQKFAHHPILDHMSWDWLEFHYQPLQALEVNVINWVPDPRVICGIHRIQNLNSQQREINLKLTFRGEMGGRGIRLSPETFQGWEILSNPTSQPNLALFLTGGTNLSYAGSNQLMATAVLGPAEMGELRWILVWSGPDTDPRRVLEKVINLDWKGEISRNKILLSTQLEVKTGHADRDYCLAFSQRQARLILNQIFLQMEKGDHSGLPLTPLQAWQLVQALTPWDSPSLERLLKGALGHNGGRILPVPLATELLGLAREAGCNPDLIGKYLPAVQKTLAVWFTPEYDKDGDGIPEEPGEDFFPLQSHLRQNGGTRITLTAADDSLETPGLAALVHNEITQLTKLCKGFPQLTIAEELVDRKRILQDFILDTWQSSQGRFQTRDYQSHLSQPGFEVSGPIHTGWHLFQLELPYPTRLQFHVQRSERAPFPENLSVTFHGQDWQGRYRVEELSSQDLLWGEQLGWGTTQSIFSRLDLCLVDGLERDQTVEITAPGSDRQDLSLCLPLWLKDLPPEIGERAISQLLVKNGIFWSDQGLKSYPKAENSPISLPLNLLVAQGLFKAGYTRLAGEIFNCWIGTITDNLLQEGCLYATWDAKTGAGVGKANQVESILPVGLLLDLLGVRFQDTQNLVLEERIPILFPVILSYRGAEITLEETETVITWPGGDQSTYPREIQAVIPL